MYACAYCMVVWSWVPWVVGVRWGEGLMASWLMASWLMGSWVMGSWVMGFRVSGLWIELVFYLLR